jgi:hypothetical protein
MARKGNQEPTIKHIQAVLALFPLARVLYQHNVPSDPTAVDRMVHTTDLATDLDTVLATHHRERRLSDFLGLFWERWHAAVASICFCSSKLG